MAGGLGAGQEAMPWVTSRNGSSNPLAVPQYAANTSAMASFFLSSFAFFIAAFFIRRYLEDMGIPKTMTRALVVFVLSLLVAYGVGWIVDLVTGG